MNTETFALVAHLAKLQKEAAECGLEKECDKEVEGGSPESATESTNASNAATFDTKENTKKPSGSTPQNKVPDNADTTVRKEASVESLKASLREASIKDLKQKLKEAAIQDGASKSEVLEANMKKEVSGGAAEGEVENASEADKAPALEFPKGAEKGDTNADTGKMQKSASAVKVFNKLKQLIPCR